MVEYTEAEQIALSMIKEFEGYRSNPYPDPATGNEPWAIGYGSTRDLYGMPVTAHTAPISEIEAANLAMLDLLAVFRAIESAIKVPLTEHERAAVEDFIYNVGGGNFRDSTLLRLINQHQFALAAKQFELWDHADGKVMAGLLHRRLAEEKTFNATDS